MWFSSRADFRSRPNGFSTMTRASWAKPASAEVLDDGAEQARRDGQVVHGPCRVAERLLQLREGRRVVVVAVDVAEPARRARWNAARRRRRRAARGCRGPGPGTAGPVQATTATPITGKVSTPRFAITAAAPGRSSCRPGRRSRRRTRGRRRATGLLIGPGPASLRGRRTPSASPRAACRRSRPRRAT